MQLKKEMERRQPARTPEQWSELGDGPTNPPVAKAHTSDDKNDNKSNHVARPMLVTQEDGPEPNIEDHNDKNMPEIGLRRSEHVKSQVRPNNIETHHIANMASMEKEMQGLVLTAQARMRGFTAANCHLQMNE